MVSPQWNLIPARNDIKTSEYSSELQMINNERKMKEYEFNESLCWVYTPK